MNKEYQYPKKTVVKLLTKFPKIDGQKVWFIHNITGKKYEGVWIKDEQMFFIGFQETGKFFYTFEIESWGILSDDDTTENTTSISKTESSLYDQLLEFIFYLVVSICIWLLLK